MEVLSDEENKYFIDLVYRYPCLYNSKNPHYKDARVRENVWQEIAQEMNITGESCKRQWKTIRDGYMRYRRRNKLPIGSVVPKTKRTKWKLYRLLSFLDKVPRENYSFSSKDDESGSSQISADVENAEETADLALNNIKQETDDMLSEDNKQQENASTDIEQVYIPATPSAEQQMRIKKRSRSGDVFSIKKMRGNTKPLINIPEGTDDEFKSFAKYTEQVLKNLPTKLLQVNAKREIFDVLSKYEVLAAEHMPRCPTPSYNSLYQSSSGQGSPLVSASLAPTPSRPSSSTYGNAMASGSDSDSDQ